MPTALTPGPLCNPQAQTPCARAQPLGPTGHLHGWRDTFSHVQGELTETGEPAHKPCLVLSTSLPLSSQAALVVTGWGGGQKVPYLKWRTGQALHIPAWEGLVLAQTPFFRSQWRAVLACGDG